MLSVVRPRFCFLRSRTSTAAVLCFFFPLVEEKSNRQLLVACIRLAIALPHFCCSAFLSDGSQHSLLSREDRSGSFESGADWSEVGSEFGGGDASPRSGAGSMFGASDASLPRSLASPITSQGGVGSVPEGARDIFSMPYTEQVGVVLLAEGTCWC